MSSIFDLADAAVSTASMYELRGLVKDATGLVIEGSGPFLPVGAQVTVQAGQQKIPAQVVGFKNERILFMPFSDPQGIAPGSQIVANDTSIEVLVGESLLGRVVDAFGKPLDEQVIPQVGELRSLYADPPNPVTRKRIHNYIDMGVKTINTMLTIGEGQRVAIMAGSGVGKSTLLGMIARNASSDINVIALVGERGREVREFIEKDLGPEGLARSVVIVATGNESALMRIRAATYATTVAEYFRDQGKKVILMVDSVTRLAMAQREVGLAIGEPPSTRGYTPSVFSLLPKLLERAGTCSGEGSITAIYTVLVEGDDMNEPIADTVRGIVDGHIVLSRKLASKGQYPAIEVLESVSRVMPDLVDEQLIDYANLARELLATYREAEDLITIGAYRAGQNPKVDRAVQLHDKLISFLKQKPKLSANMEESWQELVAILNSNNTSSTDNVTTNEEATPAN
jgi:flagellum-specific ATP synthase